MAQTPSEAATTQWRYTDTLLVFLAGIGWSLVASVVAVAASGVDVLAGEALPTPWIFWFVFPAQLLGSFLVLRWVSGSRGVGNLEADFGFKLESRDAIWILGGGAMLILTALITLTLQAALGAGEQNAQDLVNLVAGQGAGATAFAMVAGIAILGPILEEITYRGLLFNTVMQKSNNPTAAIVVSAAVFSAVHLVGLSAEGGDGVVGVIRIFIPPLVALFVVGVILGTIRNRTGSLSAPIFVHGGFNLIQILVLLFVPDLSV